MGAFPPHPDRLRVWLERQHARYQHRRHVSPDPLEVLYDYPDLADREVAGLVAALLAYGNVYAIRRGVADVLDRLGPRPRAYLDERPAAAIRRDFRSFRYRVTAGADMAALLVGLQRVLGRWASLEDGLLRGLSADPAVPARQRCLDAVTGWGRAIVRAAGRPLDHLLPLPSRGSACKRVNLYLRWMVRSDAVDPGGWARVDPAHLVVPLDTHMHRAALHLGLTRRRTTSLRAAVEITDALATVSPADPLRYDFALTRPGILGEGTPPRSDAATLLAGAGRSPYATPAPPDAPSR